MAADHQVVSSHRKRLGRSCSCRNSERFLAGDSRRNSCSVGAFHGFASRLSYLSAGMAIEDWAHGRGMRRLALASWALVLLDIFGCTRSTPGVDAARVEPADAACDGEALDVITGCSCDRSARTDLPRCWQELGPDTRRYQDPGCLAAWFGDPSNIDFSGFYVAEYCIPAGGCIRPAMVDVARACGSTAAIQLRIEQCAGCSTQGLACARAVVPNELDKVTFDWRGTQCESAPY